MDDNKREKSQAFRLRQRSDLIERITFIKLRSLLETHVLNDQEKKLQKVFSYYREHIN